MSTQTKNNTNTNTNTDTNKIDRLNVPKNRVDVGIPYRPVNVSKSGKPILSVYNPKQRGAIVDTHGRYMEWWPTGFNPNEHKYLLLADFAKPLLWYVYKSCVQHPWYIRHQQNRIAYWQSCADELMNPSAKRRKDMTVDELNAFEMDKLGMSPTDYIKHLSAKLLIKNKTVDTVVNNA